MDYRGTEDKQVKDDSRQAKLVVVMMVSRWITRVPKKYSLWEFVIVWM